MRKTINTTVIITRVIITRAIGPITITIGTGTDPLMLRTIETTIIITGTTSPITITKDIGMDRHTIMMNTVITTGMKDRTGKSVKKSGETKYVSKNWNVKSGNFDNIITTGAAITTGTWKKSGIWNAKSTA